MIEVALLLKGARLIDPAVDLDQIADIVVRDGLIAEVGPDLSIPKGQIIDLGNKIITPGFVDMHVHLREPGYEYKESIESGTRAAVHGGFVGIAPMANTHPITDTGAAVEALNRKIATDAHCHVYPIGAITQGQKGQKLAEMGDMHTAGAVAFSDDGKGVQNSGLVRTAMDYAKIFDTPLLLHCEDEALIDGACINEGTASTRLGMKGSPALGESLAIQRELALAQLTGCPIHICHVSTKEGVEAIRQAKAADVAVTAEVTPHHLLLTEEVIDETYDTNLKMNPPLRTEEDRQALIEGLKDGTIDCIATDHAPHAAHEKQVEFDLAAHGTTGLETAVPLLLDRLVATGEIDYATLVNALAHNPRKTLRLGPVSLKKGSIADLTVIDPDAEVQFTPEWFESKSKNSAFIDEKVVGRATDVLIDGQWAMRDGEVLTREYA